MFEKIKKKFSFCVRLYAYQIAMSIFALMIGLPVILYPQFKTVTSIFSVLLYFVIIYFTSHEAGAKDYVGRNNPINPPKKYDGFIFGCISQTINVACSLLFLVVPNITRMTLYFTMYMYCPVNYGMFGASVGDIPTTVMVVWHIVASIPAVIVIGVAYWFGYKGIKISSIFKLDKPEIHSAPREDDPGSNN